MKELRIEASVMTSLHELRAIEQQRMEDERTAIERARAADIAARELAERQRVAAEQQRMRAEREAQIRIDDTRIAAEREAWLRIEAVEAAERARHAAALEEQRVAQELELRRADVAKRRPTWMLAVTGFAIAACIALAWFAIGAGRDSQIADDKARIAKLEAEKAKQDAIASREALDKVQQELGQIDTTLVDLKRRLIEADTKAERDRLQAEVEENQRRRAAVEAAIAKKKQDDADAERRRGFDARECSKTALGCMDRKH